MREVAWIEVKVGNISFDTDKVSIEIREGWPLKGARYGEYQALRRDLPQKWEATVPNNTEFDGFGWKLPIDFLEREIGRVVAPHNVDIKNVAHVNYNSYRATVVVPSWWQPSPPPEPEEEPEPDQ